MIAAIGPALLALVGFGINDLIFKHAAARGAKPHHLVMMFGFCMLPYVAVFSLIGGGFVANPVALWGALGGAIASLGFYNFFGALRTGAVSIAAPVFRLAFVVTALLGIVLLGESLTTLKALGLAIAVLAAWLLLAGAGAGPGGAKAELTREGLARLAIATASIGVAIFCFKYGIHKGGTPASVLLAQSIGLALAATIGALANDRRLAGAITALPYGLALGLFQTMALGALGIGFVSGEVSILFPIAQLSFVVTAVVGIAFLGERLSTRKVLGLACAVAAVIVLGRAA